MLSLSSLTAGYDGGTVLHGLDLEIPEGSVHAVVGHNGAGKTTLIHTVVRAGRRRPPGRSCWPAATSRGCPRTGAPARASAWSRRDAGSSRA